MITFALARPVTRALCVMGSLGVVVAGCATTAVRPASSEAKHIEMAPIANPPTVAPPAEHEADHEHEHLHENQPPREDHPDAAAKEEAQKPPAAPAAPAAQPARAAQLRAAGLEQLNRGAIRKAVALLEQARRLDPNNALIKRDLERAIRISRAVASRP